MFTKSFAKMFVKNSSQSKPHKRKHHQHPHTHTQQLNRYLGRQIFASAFVFIRSSYFEYMHIFDSSKTIRKCEKYTPNIWATQTNLMHIGRMWETVRKYDKRRNSIFMQIVWNILWSFRIIFALLPLRDECKTWSLACSFTLESMFLM